jgi:putative phosphoesterase
MREIEDLYPEKNFYLLKGNCDFGDGETEGFIELAGKKIFFTHGHTYSVKNDYDYSTLRDKGRSMGADIVLFGHTHKPFSDYRNNIYFLNPGSARDGRYGIIDIVNGEILTSTGRLK